MSLALAVVGVVLVVLGAVALVHASYIAGAILIIAGLIVYGSRNGVPL